MKDKAVNIFWLLLGVILGLVLGYIAFNSVTPIEAGEPCCEWTKWTDVTECVAPCDSTEGTKTQERYCQREECEYSCPIVEWKWFGKTYNVQYEKSQDPHKCHRPSDKSLKKLGMSSNCIQAFKRVHKEWKDADKECKTVTVETQSQDVKCEAELVPCEPSITPTPIPEPTPTEEPKGLTEAGAPQCLDPRPVLLPGNPLVWRNGGTAIVQWQPTEGNTANIYYYQVQNPDNEHAVRDTENDGYVVIEGLSGLDWTFGIQQSNGCAGGDIVWIEDGGTNGWYLFTP